MSVLIAHRHLKKLSCCFDLVAFRNLRRIAQQNDTDLGFFEIEGKTEFPTRELNHLVQHHIAQPLYPGDAVARLTNNSDVAFDS